MTDGVKRFRNIKSIDYVGTCEASRFESNFRFVIRFVLMIRFEIFESSAPLIVLCKKRLAVVKFAFKVEFGS